MRRRLWTFQAGALLPYVLVGVLVGFYPLTMLVRMAFSQINITSGQLTFQFNGLKHLTRALSDQVFVESLKHVLVFVVVAVPIETVLGLALAICAWKLQAWWATLLRTVVLIPLLVPPVAISIVWWLMYNQQFGLINIVLRLLHLPGQNWLTEINAAIFPVIWVDIWHWTPMVFLFLYVQLLTLPDELTEAARIDGAGELQVLRYVLIPQLMPMLVVTVLFRVVFTFKIFDEIYILTSGGPGTATQIPSLYIQQVFFNQFSYGYGSFLGLLVFVLVLICVLLALTGRRGWTRWQERFRLQTS